MFIVEIIWSSCQFLKWWEFNYHRDKSRESGWIFSYIKLKVQHNYYSFSFSRNAQIIVLYKKNWFAIWRKFSKIGNNLKFWIVFVPILIFKNVFDVISHIFKKCGRMYVWYKLKTWKMKYSYIFSEVFS